MARRLSAAKAMQKLKSMTDAKKQSEIEIYQDLFPYSQFAFYRDMDDVIVSCIMDPEKYGIIKIAGVPIKKDKYEWHSFVIFHNESNPVWADSFNLMNADFEYKNHIEILAPEEVPHITEFLSDYKRFGRDEDTIKKEAHKVNHLYMCMNIVYIFNICIIHRKWL